MLEYTKLVVELYKKEFKEDAALLDGLIQEWIVIPSNTTMHTYIRVYGISGCVMRIIILLLVRIPVWWPMHMMAYMINLTVRYTFVPVFAFLHLQLNRANTNKGILAYQVYNSIYTLVQWTEWILKTVFLLSYAVDKLVNWTHTRRSVRGYIDYKIDQIVVRAHVLRNEKKKQGKLIKLWLLAKQGWTTYVTPLPKLIWQGIKIILKYINPLNYTLVKYIVYPKNRKNLIIILKCRVIIRFAIIKGLIAYGAQGWLWLRICKWMRRLVHLVKVIGIKYHPKLVWLSISYWMAFHSWYIINKLRIYVGYCYIYITAGLKWLLVCVAIISSPLLYVVLHLLYVINASKVWFTHGVWISKSSFYLMVGWKVNTLHWKSYTRIK